MAISETIYREYFNALLQGDSARCKGIIQSLLSQRYGILDLYENVFRRSLYDIGELWAKNMLTVADEHIATAITESLITQLHSTDAASGQVNKRVLVSCVSSDLHQIGAKMVANLFELSGWQSFYLGANMPVSDLLAAIERLQPDVICLSLALIEHLKSLDVTIHEVRGIDPQIPIVVGGLAFENLDVGNHQWEQQNGVHIVHSLWQLEQLIDEFS